jgi:hypothetical protein
MTPGTEIRLSLEPVVTRPRVMTPGRPHLVAVDLRLAGPIEEWPYDEEEFAFTCMLDGAGGLSTVAVNDATVLVHRFGGSYGPAEFLVTPGETAGDHSLWLSILTPRGVVIHTSELPVRVRTAPPDANPTATRSLLAPVPVARRADREQSGPRPDEADSSAQHVYIAIEPIDTIPDRRVSTLITDLLTMAGVRDGDCSIENLGPNGAFCVLYPDSVRSVPAFLIELRRASPLAGLRLCVALDSGVAGPARATPSVLLRLLSSSTLRVAEKLEDSVAVIVTDDLFQDLIDEFRRLRPWTFRSAQVSGPSEDVSNHAWFSVPSLEQLQEDLAKVLAELFGQRTSASSILADVGFPSHRIPTMQNPIEFWEPIAADFAHGVVPGGLAQLAETASHSYPENLELRRITRALREVEPSSYEVLTLVGSDRYDDFLQLVRARIDPGAEILAVSPRTCAVLIGDPPPLEEVHSIREATSGWGEVRLQLRRYAFRPAALESLLVRHTDGQAFELRGLPNTTQVRGIAEALADQYPTPDEPHDLVLERVGPQGTPHRLDPNQTLHDAGILDGDELRLVRAPAEDDDHLVALLRRPDVHLIVDGDNVARHRDNPLPPDDRHGSVVTRLGRLARETGAEVTCVFEGRELTPGAVVAPRAVVRVRVLFSEPGGSVEELIERLARAEPAERPVVVVSSDRILTSALPDSIAVVRSDVLLRHLTRTPGDTIRGPRPELAQELRDLTGADLELITIRDFMAGTKTHPASTVSDETLSELPEVENAIELPAIFTDPSTSPNLLDISHQEFEHLIHYLLNRIYSGYNVTPADGPGDRGIDFLLVNPQIGKSIVVEVKHSRRALDSHAVYEVFSGLEFAEAAAALLITTSSFTRQAREAAKDLPVTLIAGKTLLGLLSSIGIDAVIDDGS